LNLHDLASGAALHALGEPIDWRKERFIPKFEQAVLAFTLDELIERFGFPVPDFIKLDVDGNEERIIRGGLRTFSNPRLRSLLVEINENEPLVGLVESCGLKLAQRTLVTPPGETRDVFNVVFVRP
jgi:hypothetical protein